MIRELQINDGVIRGTDVRKITSIFPSLKPQFKRINEKDDYFYDPIVMGFNINRLDKLSIEFNLHVYDDVIVVMIK